MTMFFKKPLDSVLYCGVQNCPKRATYMRDVPYMGDTMLFCTMHRRAERNQGDDWYVITPELAEKELQSREHLRQTLINMQVARQNNRK